MAPSLYRHQKGMEDFGGHQDFEEFEPRAEPRVNTVQFLRASPFFS